MWVEIHTPHAESDGFSIQREVVSDTVEIHTPRAESDHFVRGLPLADGC